MWIIAQYLGNVHEAARFREIFLKTALEKELNDADSKNFQAILQLRTSMALPQREHDLVQAIFRVEVMDGLNRMYLDQNRPEEAQRTMLEARDLRKKYSLPEGSLLAGMTQMSSGQRIVEAEIKAREETDATKPAYWMERAAYYQGREEWEEQEKALRKALSLYETPELRLRGPTPGHRNVLGALQQFLRKTDRLSDAGDLFFERHEVVKDEIGPLWELYYDFGNLPVTTGRETEYVQLLKEDIGKAVNHYQSAVESGDPNEIQEFRSGLDLIRYSPELAMSMGIFDFENNPYSWDILKTQNSLVQDKIFRSYLCTVDEQYEKKLEILSTALEQEKLPVEYYYVIGEAIRMNVFPQKLPKEEYKTAIHFFEGALRNFDRFSDNHPKRAIHSQLASCSLELGDVE